MNNILPIIANCVSLSIDTFINTSPGKSKHEHVKAFQNELKNNLSEKDGNYYWMIEAKESKVKVNDSIDIYGEPKNGIPIVIEIDAWRADQIAKKWVSRSVMCSLKGQKKESPYAINYVAILYPQNKSNLYEALKYIDYCDLLAKQMNKQSSCAAIVFDKQENLFTYEPTKQRQFVVYAKNDESNKRFCKSMTDAARESIQKIINQYQVTDDKLKKQFDKVVDNTKHSRAKTAKLIDGTSIYVCSQWRKMQPQWDEFVTKVQKKHIIIEEVYIGRDEKYYKISLVSIKIH